MLSSLPLAAAALLSLPLAQGDGDPFSYDPTAPNGPRLWPTLDASATGYWRRQNQCSLSSQSPIGINAIEFCRIENADYTFDVSTLHDASYYMISFFLLSLLIEYLRI